MYYRPQINTHGVESSRHEPETPIGFMFEHQVLQFSTQVVIENTRIKKKMKDIPLKKHRELLTSDDDTLLMQPQLKVSNDPIMKVDKKADNFLLKITANYN